MSVQQLPKQALAMQCEWASVCAQGTSLFLQQQLTAAEVSLAVFAAESTNLVCGCRELVA